MGLLNCTFPDKSQPLDLASEFQTKMAPTEIEIDETDVFAVNIAKMEAALGDSPEKGSFQPLLSMKRNAHTFGPQYRIWVRDKGVVMMTGAVNRRTLNLTWNDPIPDEILSKVLQFANGLPDVEIEVEDDAGNPIHSAAHAMV